MDKKALYLRICFLTGAIADAVFVLPLTFPSLVGPFIGIENYSPDPTALYMMHVGASLMAGWTGILFWAALRPIERRGIIPITIFPLLPGLMAAGVNYYLNDGISLIKIVPLLAVSMILLIAQTIGYCITRQNSGGKTMSHKGNDSWRKQR